MKTVNALLYIGILVMLMLIVCVAPFKLGCGPLGTAVTISASVAAIGWVLLFKRIMRTFEDDAPQG